VSGEVVAVNEELFDRPELVNEDPYGDGWLLEVEPVEGGDDRGAARRRRVRRPDRLTTPELAGGRNSRQQTPDGSPQQTHDHDHVTFRPHVTTVRSTTRERTRERPRTGRNTPMSGTSGTPYAPHTDAETSAMLSAIGVDDEEALFDIPNAVAFDGDFGIESRSEREIRAECSQIFARNDDIVEFLGGGHYGHYVPSVVDHLADRAEFLTSYTQYQPEISQGILAGAVRVPVDARGAHRAPDRELLDVRRRHCAR